MNFFGDDEDDLFRPIPASPLPNYYDDVNPPLYDFSLPSQPAIAAVPSQQPDSEPEDDEVKYVDDEADEPDEPPRSKKSKPNKGGNPCRNWVFTINNYTQAHIDTIKRLEVRHGCAATEIGESGTPHIQGACSFKRNYRFAAVLKLLSGTDDPKSAAAKQIHLEAAKCVTDYNYLKKHGSDIFWEVAKSQGKRNDWLELTTAIRGGMQWDEIRFTYPNLAAHAKSFILELIEAQNVPSAPTIQLYEWQSKMLEELHKPPHPRKIYIVVDPVGGNGKTTFAKFLMSEFPGLVQYVSGAKATDIFHSIGHPKVVIFDFPRASDDFRPWASVEKIKDGIFFSSKYDSRSRYIETPHVIVFTNSMIEAGKLSKDRIEIIRLSEDQPTSDTFIVPNDNH